MPPMLKRFTELIAQIPNLNQARIWGVSYWLFPGLFLLGGIGIWYEAPDFLDDFRNRVFDEYNRKSPRKYMPEAPVIVVDIDDASLARPELGQWPWSRVKIAGLIQRLNELGAGVIAFDVLFAEPDRTSPKSIIEQLPQDIKFRFSRQLIGQLEDNDEILARTIAETDNVVLGIVMTGDPHKIKPLKKGQVLFRSKQSVGVGKSVKDLKEISKAKGGKNIGFEAIEVEDPLLNLRRFDGALTPLLPLMKAAPGLGAFNSEKDRDGVIRRVPLIFRFGQSAYPSLVAESLRTAFGGRFLTVMSNVEGGGFLARFAAGIQKVVIRSPALPKPFEIPTDSYGEVLLYDSGWVPERFIPAWEIFFDPKFDPERVAGKIVFIGTSAAGLKDLRATPLNQDAAGVEVHAQIAEQIFMGQYLNRPSWAEWVEAIFFISFGLLFISLAKRMGPVLSTGVAAFSIFAAVMGSWWGYTEKHVLIDMIYPSIMVFGIYLSSTIFNYLKTASEKKQVRGQFSRYLSPDLVEQLANDPSKLSLGGETRELTLMFSDIRGFTPISEQFDAQGLTKFINRFLTPMTDIVIQHKGTIDKYMGDCIMAFWNAPLDNKKHARDACSSSLAMKTRLEELNVEWEALAKKEGRKYIPVHVGFGLNTGECCVGNMGSDQRFDYSVLGDPVNLASRLEGQSKSYGIEIVIGKNTRDLVPEFAMIELDLIRVKGKLVPAHIYTLLGETDTAESSEFKNLAEANAKMINAYRAQKWDEAEEAIVECRKFDFPLSKFYDVYDKRLEEARANPPAEDWDGVYVATTK